MANSRPLFGCFFLHEKITHDPFRTLRISFSVDLTTRAPLPRCESQLVQQHFPTLHVSVQRFPSCHPFLHHLSFPIPGPAVSLLSAFLPTLFLSFSSSGLSCFWGLFGLSLPRCVVSGFAHLVARVAPSGTPSSWGVPVGASLIEHPIQQALVGSNWRPGTHPIPAGLQFQPPNNQPALKRKTQLVFTDHQPEKDKGKGRRLRGIRRILRLRLSVPG